MNSSTRSLASEKNFKLRNVANPGIATVSNGGGMSNKHRLTYNVNENDDVIYTQGEIRHQQERSFIDKCNAVSLMVKNKDIKFFECVGDEPIQ